MDTENNYVKEEKNIQISNESNFDEELIKAYIGKNSDKLYKIVLDDKINFSSVFFGAIYFVYRKMYLITFAWYVLFFIIEFISPKISSIFNFVVPFAFAPLYKWDVTRKLRKIKLSNPNASKEELLEKAKNKGGTSIIATIILSFIIIGCLILTIGLK